MTGRRWWIFVACFGWIAAPAVLAQEKPAALVYEIVSVRVSAPDAHEGYVNPMPSGIGYDAKGITVKDMLSVMYRTPWRQISGGPGWVSTQRFDVQARADHSYSIDDLHLMFQRMLADRFKLRLHKEVKTGPVYVLTIAKSGLKMTPVDAGKDRNLPITNGPNNQLIGSRVPMNYLVYWLGQRLENDQRPVIDKTGLTGTYDFTLSFRPQLAPGASTDGLSPEVESLPSIFAAMRDQLGLELVPQRGPVETLVIDSIEQPSAN